MDGVVDVAALYGILHCLDARTGKRFWWYDTKSSIWSSAYYADGKVFLVNDQGDLNVFRHRPNPAVEPDPDDALAIPFARQGRALRRQLIKEVEAKVLIRKVELDAAIRATPCVAGGVLDVATEKTLYAVGTKR